MSYNNNFPVTYTPVVANPTNNGVQNGYMNGYQYNPYQNNLNTNQPNNMQSAQQYIPQIPIQDTASTNTGDIVWIQDENEVKNFPVAKGQNVMFMNINQMKMYTKDGSNGLIRDFTLTESPESMQRAKQMDQIQNAQFPIVNYSVQSVQTSSDQNEASDNSQEIINAIEDKINERFSVFEQKVNDLSKSINDIEELVVNQPSTTTSTTTKTTRSTKGAK